MVTVWQPERVIPVKTFYLFPQPSRSLIALPPVSGTAPLSDPVLHLGWGCVLHTSLHAASLAPGPSSPKTRTLIWSPACPWSAKSQASGNGCPPQHVPMIAVCASSRLWSCSRLPCSVVRCWDFPIIIARDWRGTLLMAEKPWLVLGWGLGLYKFRFWQGQVQILLFFF